MEAPSCPNSALEAHYREWHHSIVAKAYFIVGNTDDAKDIAQEAYLRLAGQNYTTIKNPRAWLLTVARNLALKRLTKKRRLADGDISERYDLDSDTPSPAELAQRKEFKQEAVQALLQLPLAQREAVELIYLQQLSPKDAALVMNKNANAVYQLTHSGLAKLKIILEQKNKQSVAVGSIN